MRYPKTHHVHFRPYLVVQVRHLIEKSRFPRYESSRLPGPLLHFPAASLLSSCPELQGKDTKRSYRYCRLGN